MTNHLNLTFRILRAFIVSLKIWGSSNTVEASKGKYHRLTNDPSIATKVGKSYNTHFVKSDMQKKSRVAKSAKKLSSSKPDPNTPVPTSTASNRPSINNIVGVPSTSTSSSPFPIPSSYPSDKKCCDLSTFDYENYLTSIAVSISGSISPGTPQQQALDWFKAENNFCECGSNSCKLIERYALAVFYFSTHGDEWTKCNMPDLNSQIAIDEANTACDITTTTNSQARAIGLLPDGADAWLTPVDYCSWAGIVCRTSSTCIDRLEFEQNNVIGTLPAELNHLFELRFLILERGGLTGPIPPEWNTLTELLHLDFDFNKLTGSIPSYIYGLTDMLQLDLNDNELIGSLQSDIGTLTNLVYLQLDHNELSGSLPSELGNLINLRVGIFSSNKFTGTINPVLGNYSLVALESDCGGDNPKVVCAPCTKCNSN